MVNISGIIRGYVMGEKSRENWDIKFCIGYCKFKNNDINTGECITCSAKSNFKDCREECENFNFKCKDCDDGKWFKKRKT